LIQILREWDRQAWDGRYWGLALKTKNPIEEFNKIMDAETKAASEVSVDIDSLPEARKRWYRA